MRTLEWIEERCEKIPECGCWIWMGSLKQGYGCFRDKWRGPTKDAHRSAYAAFHGGIPEGLWVLHKCDVRSCCNPHHLFAGTRHDNIQDAVSKGRLKGVSRNRPSGLIYKSRKEKTDEGI